MASVTVEQEIAVAKRRGSFEIWLRRLYTPSACLLILLLCGNWLATKIAVNPIAAAQNPRVRFQIIGDVASAPPVGLNAEETRLADQVMQPLTGAHPGQVPLLYIGNSQTYAIMDWNSGDISSPQWLQVFLSRKRSKEGRLIEVHSGSLPEITMTEYLIRLIDTLERVPQTRIVVLQAVLAGFRGLGVRQEVSEEAELSTVRRALASLVARNADLRAARTALTPYLTSRQESQDPAKASNATVAQRLEARLQESLDQTSLFGKRQKVRARFGVMAYVWRNRLLHIDTSSLRPLAPSAYQASLQLIELSLRYAQSKGVHVVVYLAPIRPIEPNPNAPADVKRFRKDMPDLCKQYGAICLDLVDLIPERLWTNYSSEFTTDERNRPDFAHFTGAAHKLVAETLMTHAGPQLLAWGNQ